MQKLFYYETFRLQQGLNKDLKTKSKNKKSIKHYTITNITGIILL